MIDQLRTRQQVDCDIDVYMQEDRALIMSMNWYVY